MTVAPTRHHTANRPNPTRGHAVALVDALAALPAGDPARPAARTAAIAAWQPMARRLAYRYAGHGEPVDDLVQVAAVGLITAIDGFDGGRGIPFTAFAVPTIIGGIKRHFRDRGWAVRVPRRLQELRLAINAANSTLAQTLARHPTASDIAVHLGITEEAVIEGLEGARAYRATSLSTPASGDVGTELGDTLGVPEPGYDAVDRHETLQPAIASLNQRDRRLIAMRFFGDQTQTQIGVELGVSQMQVSRLLTRALGRLRLRIDADR